MKIISTITIVFLAGLLPCNTLQSQELEPRALTNIPMKSNFVIAGYAYANGNILMDPALPIEDFNGKLNTLIMAYARSVNFFGKSGKLDIILPYGVGDWTGNYAGKEFDDSSTGLGDLRIRATVNFTGAPALQPADFGSYKQKLVSGMSIQIIMPTGNYNEEQIANLGSNRFTLRMMYGISRTYTRWVIEGYMGLWLFSDNKEFLVDNTLSQSPLWVVKSHLTRNFNNGMWLALDAGYGYGAETWVNNEKRDAVISAMRFGLTYSVPINPHHTLKFAAVTGVRFEQGGDFDAVGVVYQYRWNRKVNN